MPSPTQQIGAHYEQLAEDALSAAGYQIEARNWRGGGGEIDRIARDGEVLVFVEIRARKRDDRGTPAETVRLTKQGRVIRAALAYLAGRNGPLPATRFDVVAIVDREGAEPQIEIFRAAFDASPLFGRRSIPLV